MSHELVQKRPRPADLRRKYNTESRRVCAKRGRSQISSACLKLAPPSLQARTPRRPLELKKSLEIQEGIYWSIWAYAIGWLAQSLTLRSNRGSDDIDNNLSKITVCRGYPSTSSSNGITTHCPCVKSIDTGQRVR